MTYFTLNRFRRALNIFADGRMPFYLPYTLYKQWRITKLLQKDLPSAPRVYPILFSLTIDTEQDHGSSSRDHSFSTLEIFWQNFLIFAQKLNCPSTFFLQGDILSEAQKSSPSISFLHQALAHGHEIGLHGYHHELWGKPTWFSAEKHLSRSQRVPFLQKALQHFKDTKLPRPRSFRAPNLIVDDATYRALEKTSFDYDSSSSVFKGANLLPHQRKGIKIVPLSTDPLPHIRWHSFFPVGEYRVLNMYQLCHQPEEVVWGMIERIIKYQQLNGIQPHLVFLAHSWEFVLWEEAYVKLDRLIQRLRSQFEIHPLTFSQICERLF